MNVQTYNEKTIIISFQEIKELLFPIIEAKLGIKLAIEDINFRIYEECVDSNYRATGLKFTLLSNSSDSLVLDPPLLTIPTAPPAERKIDMKL